MKTNTSVTRTTGTQNKTVGILSYLALYLCVSVVKKGEPQRHQGTKIFARNFEKQPRPNYAM